MIKKKTVFAVVFLIAVFSLSANEVDNTASSSGNKSKKLFFDFDPYFNTSFGIGFWEFGPSIFTPKIAFNTGLLVEFSSFKFGVASEAGGFTGFAIPLFDDMGIVYGYHFGSFLEFFFDFYGFSLGGGIISGDFLTKNELLGEFFFPFTELHFWVGDETESIGIYIRYYFNDSREFYNKFAIGLKTRLF